MRVRHATLGEGVITGMNRIPNTGVALVEFGTYSPLFVALNLLTKIEEQEEPKPFSELALLLSNGMFDRKVWHGRNLTTREMDDFNNDTAEYLAEMLKEAGYRKAPSPFIEPREREASIQTMKIQDVPDDWEYWHHMFEDWLRPGTAAWSNKAQAIEHFEPWRYVLARPSELVETLSMPIEESKSFSNEAAAAQWHWYVSKGLSDRELVIRFREYLDATFPEPVGEEGGETDEEYRQKTWIRFSAGYTIPPAFVHVCVDGLRHTKFLPDHDWNSDKTVFQPVVCGRCGKGGKYTRGAWDESATVPGYWLDGEHYSLSGELRYYPISEPLKEEPTIDGEKVRLAGEKQRYPEERSDPNESHGIYVAKESRNVDTSEQHVDNAYMFGDEATEPSLEDKIRKELETLVKSAENTEIGKIHYDVSLKHILALVKEHES